MLLLFFPIGVFRCLVIFGDGDAEACPKDLFEQPKESNFASPDSSSQCLSGLVLQLWLCVCVISDANSACISAWPACVGE